MREEKREKIAFHKSGSSNLLVDRKKSMVQLIIFVLSLVVKDEFPNSNIWAREVSVLSNNLWSSLLKLFRSVQRSLLYKGKWRKKWIAVSTSYKVTARYCRVEHSIQSINTSEEMLFQTFFNISVFWRICDCWKLQLPLDLHKINWHLWKRIIEYTPEQK